MNNPRNSSYAIIPSYILDDDELEEGAKNLYARISMYSEDGRCWASNQHFADKHKVSIRTIQNWLKQLIDKEYIEIEIEKGGFQTKRNIWIINDFKKHSTKRNVFHVHMQHTSRPDEAQCTSYIETSNTIQIKQQQEPACAVDAAGSFQENPKSAIKILADRAEKNPALKKAYEEEKQQQKDSKELQFTETEREQLNNYSAEQIAEAIDKTNIDCIQTRNSSRVKYFFKIVGNCAKSPKKPIPEENKIWAEEELKKWLKYKYVKVDFCSNRVEFLVTNTASGCYQPTIIDYSEYGFRDKFESALRKHNCRKKNE